MSRVRAVPCHHTAVYHVKIQRILLGNLDAVYLFQESRFIKLILERSEVYSGVYGRASINLYVFNSNGNRGIACGLNNLQKISDGEPLGGKSRAEDDFSTEDDDDYLS